ncbi:MAG: hypothetical protein OHK0029_35930 [Armatimonadaceae bacterium]
MRCRFLLWLFISGLFIVFGPSHPAKAQDHLLFCNTPERITMPGSYATAILKAGETYTVFFHYKNFTGSSGKFVVGLQGTTAGSVEFDVKKGIADPQRSPSEAGRQAMARFLSSPEKPIVGKKGYARFDFTLRNRQVASGILTIRCKSDTRLRLYYRHSKWDVKGSQVVQVTAPRRQVEIALGKEAQKSYYRIGEPEDQHKHPHFDGTYGMLYAFKVAAPAGSKVRVAFSPRGGTGGLVGSVNGKTIQSDLIPATHWRVFYEAVVGKDGMILTTAPFGGVFYPVELLFELL